MELTFKVAETVENNDMKRHARYEYPLMVKNLKTFKLSVQPGEFSDSEIVVMLGQNGTKPVLYDEMCCVNEFVFVLVCLGGDRVLGSRTSVYHCLYQR